MGLIDHFLVMARPAWDFCQPLSNDPPIWGTSFLELPEFFNITALTFESRAYSYQEMAIPYPTSFHPPKLALFDSWVNRVRRSIKDKRPGLKKKLSLTTRNGKEKLQTTPYVLSFSSFPVLRLTLKNC